MDSINKTLYIPLYGKALVSKKGIILSDKKAEQIWDTEGFPLKSKSRSRWLAYFLAMRAAVFDEWTKEKMAEDSNAIILNIGCGLDSRVLRVGTNVHLWYDIDLGSVIELRRRYYTEDECYRMLVGDIRDSKWLKDIPHNRNAVIVMEGISMYIKNDELKMFMNIVSKHFPCVCILMDCYTEKGAKATKVKNPINTVGVTVTYGIDDPGVLEKDNGFSFVGERDMTPANLIDELKGFERIVFKRLYGGKISKSFYRMYEYKKVSAYGC